MATNGLEMHESQPKPGTYSDDGSRSFIHDKFRIRECYKYKEEKQIDNRNVLNQSSAMIRDGRCVCNKKRREHREEPEENEPWSHANNTESIPNHDTFGVIGFPEATMRYNKFRTTFIRFDPSEANTETCDSVYTLLTSHGKLVEPKLIISIIAGTRKTKFISKLHERNFYEGLFNVFKYDITWVIGNGYASGSHNLISEIVQIFRSNKKEETIKKEKRKNVFLIGIASWNNIRDNDKLASKNYGKDDEFAIPDCEKVEGQKEKFKIKEHYNTFLFCDCEPRNHYNEEMEFRLAFQNYIKKKHSGLLVQILISGEREDIKTICRALEKKVSHVIIKGSGQIADIISEIVEIPIDDYDGMVDKVLSKYERLFMIPNGKYRKEEIDEDKIYLQQMHKEYREHIVIYDMTDTSVKFDKKIIEAIIIGSEKVIKETLELCLTFNCPDIADRFVFSNPGYECINPKLLGEYFMESLKENKYKFVELFIENDFNIEVFLESDKFRQLHKITLDPNECECAELIRNISRNKKSSCEKRKDKNEADNLVDTVVLKLSGYTVHKIYGVLERKKKPCSCCSDVCKRKVKQWSCFSDVSKSKKKKLSDFCDVNLEHLFLWALLCGRIDLALVIWKITPNYMGSALMASYILKNMYKLIMAQGDQLIHQKLKDGSKMFEELAIEILEKCYNTNKEQTYILIDKELKPWNGLTCLDIAIYGNMFNFLYHSACQSYTTNLWMGELSPFLPIWKILLGIPFNVILSKILIIPSSTVKGIAKDDVNRENQRYMRVPKEETSTQNNTNLKNDKCYLWLESLITFYEAPVVKFCIHLMSYIAFLLIFGYLNLVELKPLEEVQGAKDVIAEIFVYIYILSYVVEEIRQVSMQRIHGFVPKIKAYFSKSWNWVDVFALSLFIMSTVVRFIINKNHFMICRFLFALCLCVFFLRSMQFYFVNKSIGPKVIMIKKMFRDIGFFLCIFLIFLMCFGTLSQTLRAPNSNLNLELISDIVYYPYFQVYGELMLDEFRGSRPCNGTLCDTKNALMTVSLGAFLLLTNVLLINLLIAMFGFTFNEVQVNSERLWCHIRYQLVQEYKEKQIIPPPFNIIYFFLLLCKCLFAQILKKLKIIKPILQSPKNDLQKCLTEIKFFEFEQKCVDSVLFRLQEDKTTESVKN